MTKDVREKGRGRRDVTGREGEMGGLRGGGGERERGRQTQRHTDKVREGNRERD